MKNSEDRWQFWGNLTARKQLNAEEVRYWKTNLHRILKVGFEFEFNLPEGKNGICKRNNNACPCINMTATTTCWRECVSQEQGNCAVLNEGKECVGVYCSEFVSKCFSCTSYARDCDTCKYLYDPKKNPDEIRNTLANELVPNNTYGQISKYGVHSIVTDGSLLGKKGAEIITTGRRVDYWEFFNMNKRIIDNAVSRGGYTNERCSIHMHLLATYYGKIAGDGGNNSVPPKINEMERDMPEIILANLHQLIRRYQNAMTWMVMGLDEPNRMTRWEKFRVSVLPVSAVARHMRDVRDEVCNRAEGKKYGWVNYNRVGFSNSGDVERFHVEFRAADGILSQSAVSAVACMYYALVIKAVEISRYGVLDMGDKPWLKKATEIKSAIMNNTKAWDDGDRFSDTSQLMKYSSILIDESFDLIRQLKSILIKVGPAYEVLEKLAEKPCALRRQEGRTWEEIEDELKIITTEEDTLNLTIRETIVLNKVAECTDEEEWIKEVSRALSARAEIGVDGIEDKVRKFMSTTKENGELIWSSKIGGPILI